jgi:hypothetical protein
MSYRTPPTHCLAATTRRKLLYKYSTCLLFAPVKISEWCISVPYQDHDEEIDLKLLISKLPELLPNYSLNLLEIKSSAKPSRVK